jgi:hypothetical protein
MAVGLLLSARSEEKVHEMAMRLDGPEWPTRLPPAELDEERRRPDGPDGSVDGVAGCAAPPHAGPR